MMPRVFKVAIAVVLFSAGVAHASWYDNYDAGLDAVRKGNWSKVVQEMSAAIKGNANENNRARTYGMNYLNYHPYYYRGVAYLQLGRYQEAVADFERTSGPGPENLGSIDTLMERAKKAIAAESAPAPEPPAPEPARTVPTPVTTPARPVAPQIDPALRQRANDALAEAKQKLQEAQRKGPSTPQYAEATKHYSNAASRLASARSNDDLNAAIASARNAVDMAELVPAPTAPASVVATTPAVTTPIVPKPTRATSHVMQDDETELKEALQLYFAGDFDQAEPRFEALARKMPRNGWIYAFLGASQYSLYAFEADPAYREKAVRSFKRAKELRSWGSGLPAEYFSTKIRKAFQDAS